MKVGDYILCKLSHHKQHIEKGIKYEICEIHSDGIIINNPEYALYYDTTTKLTKFYFHKAYYTKLHYEVSDDYHIWDYFYKPKELRNLKLQKINESRQ